jgi:hypothetical protein
MRIDVLFLAGANYFFSSSNGSAFWGPNQHPKAIGTRCYPPAIHDKGREFDYPYLSTSGVKNGITIPPLPYTSLLLGSELITRGDKFTFLRTIFEISSDLIS